MHVDAQVAPADEPIHELVSALPSAVRCGMDPKTTLVLQVTTIALLATCPACKRAKREAVARGR